MALKIPKNPKTLYRSGSRPPEPGGLRSGFFGQNEPLHPLSFRPLGRKGVVRERSSRRSRKCLPQPGAKHLALRAAKLRVSARSAERRQPSDVFWPEGPKGAKLCVAQRSDAKVVAVARCEAPVCYLARSARSSTPEGVREAAKRPPFKRPFGARMRAHPWPRRAPQGRVRGPSNNGLLCVPFITGPSEGEGRKIYPKIKPLSVGLFEKRPTGDGLKSATFDRRLGVGILNSYPIRPKS